MKPLVINTPLFVALALAWTTLLGCEANGNASVDTAFSSPDSATAVEASRSVNSLDGISFPIENTPITITRSPEAVTFMEEDELSDLLVDLKGYFSTQNDGDFAGTLQYYPLYRANMDSAQQAQTVELMSEWWDKGLHNQTEFAEILYVSMSHRDGDQDVVLLNMDLIHRVVFIDFQGGNPSGWKGMVESNYGKGNATFHSVPGTPKLEYWEVRGDNRMWAVKQVDSDHWCFLPANFNERGGGQFMTVDAMTALLRHRSENDPFRLN